MKKTILLNDCRNDASKSINKYLIENLSQDYDIAFNQLHNRLFHTQQTIKGNALFWAASEYTQEFHDYVVEYQNDVAIFLLVDVYIQQKELIDFLNNSNIKLISNKNIDNKFTSCFAEYGDLYEDSIFYNMQKERNDKTIAILSHDNDKNNQILNPITYPVSDHKVIALGNPEYDSPINLGIFNSPDLSQIFNTFLQVIDLSGRYRLQAQACNIPYIDIETQIDISNPQLNAEIDNLETCTYKHFVNNNIIPFIRNKV